jgi:hypothetical protein
LDDHRALRFEEGRDLLLKAPSGLGPDGRKRLK